MNTDNSTKRYKLTHDNICSMGNHSWVVPEGHVFEFRVDRYISQNGWYFNKEFVENNPKHFELLPSQPDKEDYNEAIIKIFDRGIGKDYFLADGTRLCPFSSYEMLFDQLQQVLEDKFAKEEGECVFDEENINERLAQLEEIEKAFNAAREVDGNKKLGDVEYTDGDCGELHDFKYPTYKDYQASLIPIPSSILEKGEKAANYFHNAEHPIIKPEWEILTCENDCFGVHKFVSEKDSKTPCLKPNKPCRIHSVKRLSDGEVFSIGDEFHLCGGICRYKISSFLAEGNIMWVIQTGYPQNAQRVSLPHLIKLTPILKGGEAVSSITVDIKKENLPEWLPDFVHQMVKDAFAKEILEAESKAFYAAREGKCDRDTDYLPERRYKTFSDYKNKQ